MSTVALVPVDEYLRNREKPNREYRDGVLSPKAMPTFLHGFIQSLLCQLLTRLGLFAAAEVRLPVTPSKYLVPDVVADRQLHLTYPAEPVLLCCEILSPDDHIGAMLAKCEDYHAWGVPYCWVIDPMKRTGWQYHRGGEPARVDGILQAGEYSVELRELFANLPTE